MPTAAADQTCLRTILLRRLAGLAAPEGQRGTIPYGANGGVQVFGYCVQERERIPG